MRKTSKDTGDTMSVNSGVENDIRKSDINTKKRNSIKKKVQNFSHESDDTALVPLLQTYKDKPDIAKQSAKYTLSKTKTDSIHEEEEDILKNKDKDIERGNLCKPATTAHNISTNIVNERSKMLDSVIVCSPTTHVFGSKSMTSSYNTTTNSLLIEMNDKTTSSVNTNALIFTTAKIHTDSKPKTMDSIQLSSTPILSTAEGNFIRAEITPILCNLPPKPDLMTASNLNKVMSQSTNEPACKANSKKSGQATNEIKTLLDKSSTNNFVDKILEKDVKDMSKVLPSTTSTPLPTYFYTAGIHREQNNQVKNKPGDDTKITMKTDTQITKDENKINSKIMNDNKKSADTKLENTSSIKKLQRQKHAAVEESNNSNMTHSENKNKNIESQVEKSTKTIDTPNTNPLKTNGSIQTDTLKRTTLSTVQTKIVKTCPMSCTSGTEKIATVSTTAPISKSVTTVKSITTGAMNSNKETSSDSSSLLKSSSDTKGPGSGSTQSTSTVKLINTSKDVKDETKDLVTKIVMPTTSITANTSTQPFCTFKLPQTSSVSKIENAKKSAPLTSTSKVPPTVDKTLKINKTKPNSSMESESFAINSKQSSAVSTSSNNVPVCTPLYIVATSKTKIGGTPTSNTAGISKAQIDNSITQVVSTVRTTPTAIGKPLDIPMSEIDPKDLKIKPTTSKSSLKK